MKIPEKIKIGGKTYTVEITSKMDLGINNVSAEILYGDLIIRVSPQATAKMTVIHDDLVNYYEMPDDGAWLADRKLQEIGVDVAAWNAWKDVTQ